MKGQALPTARPCVAVVGLGYVGRPLVEAFSRSYRAIGFDTSEATVDACRRAGSGGEFTTDPSVLSEADVVVVSVPTPVTESRQPDFTALRDCSACIGRHMKQGTTVVYESTVYPGATEELCVPLLEAHSGKVWKRDFFVGYSPERINPGDPDHGLGQVVKLVAGDIPETTARLRELYGSVVPAGVHVVSSIRVAEAAKVIENTQRDLNVALMNEFAMLFHRLDLDTREILEAAETKWNFLGFRPGLVGGHCIGVDPYYLTYKAEAVGYSPQVILAGRRVNDAVPSYVAEQTVRRLARQGRPLTEARVLLLGLTFKENVIDLRNSGALRLGRELAEFGCRVYAHDPLLEDAAEPPPDFDGLEARRRADWPTELDAVVLAVAHAAYVATPLEELLRPLSKGGLFVDVKSVHLPSDVARLGYQSWCL